MIINIDDGQNEKNVAEKNISSSFRGLLRVSPGEDKIDGGIAEVPLPVYDSLGFRTTLEVGLKNINVINGITAEGTVPSDFDTNYRNTYDFGIHSNTAIKDTFTLVDTTKESTKAETLVRVETPEVDDILIAKKIGEELSQYIKPDLINTDTPAFPNSNGMEYTPYPLNEYISKYLDIHFESRMAALFKKYYNHYIAQYKVMEQTVPVGTIVYVMIKFDDNTYSDLDILHRLPEQYWELDPFGQKVECWWDVCHGQNSNTSSGFTYTAERYPELAAMWGETGSFSLPDLRNKFIRSASKITNGDFNELGERDDTYYDIPAHMPNMVEQPATNPSTSKVVFEAAGGTFGASTYQDPGTCSRWCTPPFSIIQTAVTSGHRKYRGNSILAKFKMDFSSLMGGSVGTVRETHPYNITLIPLVKVRNTPSVIQELL